MDQNSAAVFSAYVAGISAVLSLLSIGWNWYVYKKDRPIVTMRAGIAKMVPDMYDQDYLTFTITNIGRRPVQITHLCGSYLPWWGPILTAFAKWSWVKRVLPKLKIDIKYTSFFIVTTRIPCKLEEGSYVCEFNPVTEDTLMSIIKAKKMYVCDSTGCEWVLPRSQLKKLINQAKDLLNKQENQ